MLLPPGTYTGLSDRIVVPGKDPYNFGPAGQFVIDKDMIEDLERNGGTTQKYWDAYLIPDALENPTVILEGLQRTNYADGFCYCHIPQVRFKSETETFKPPPMKVFAVYVNPSDGDLIVLDWDWRIVGPGGTGIPHRWERHFRRIAWPTT